MSNEGNKKNRNTFFAKKANLWILGTLICIFENIYEKLDLINVEIIHSHLLLMFLFWRDHVLDLHQ